MISRIHIKSHRQGLTNITHEINSALAEHDVSEGLCTVFIRHTSASLIIQENADPSARHDLENWLNRLVQENDPLYTHTLEGPDDMPAHIKSILTSTSLSVPFAAKSLLLGTWQGIYLWEHRHHGGSREIIIHSTP
ncbi:MAG: secondary thiamine-phosphate synthase enzyme YjbQ [Gammaproteobacteria bacterium]|nr:secondary thiamine-phosphate synthase enzyme YjbQ [Gammaproteobacteria bacterium]